MENSVFKIPQKVLDQLSTLNILESIEGINESLPTQPLLQQDITCQTCRISTNPSHYKSDYHRYNLKSKLKLRSPISEIEFEELQDVSSIDSADESDSDDAGDMHNPRTTAPYNHFEMENKQELLVYKQIMSPKTREHVNWHEKLLSISGHKQWSLIMIQSGHFAGAVITSTGKQIVHKAFHRYTTRRKQGGAQSSNDQSKGNAHSAGATIRRYNEQALREEIENILTEWKELLKNSDLIFIHTPVKMKKVLTFNKNVLDLADNRVRSFPFITKRPTLDELMRCYSKLSTYLIIDKIKCLVEQKKELIPKSEVEKTHLVISEELEISPPQDMLKLIDFVKRGKIELLKANLSSLDSSKIFHDPSDSSLIHIASKVGQHDIVEYLLELGVDPARKIRTSRPYDVAGSKETRNVFRKFMNKYPERWDYAAANIPGPLTAEMEAKQKAKDLDRRKKEKDRKLPRTEAAENKIPLESPEINLSSSKVKLLRKSKMFGQSQAEREAMGMSAAQRQRLDREKRALAAESRMRSQGNRCGCCDKSLDGISTFDKSIYRYCSMVCLTKQQILF